VSAAPGRVACLAFDSAGIGFLEQGIEAGRLPTLAGLLERGRAVALADHQAIATPASWATLIRGADLPDHGLYADRMLAPGEYRVRDVAPEDGSRDPVWRHLSDAGIRSVVLSAYSATLLDAFDGVQVSGWGSHDPYDAKLGRVRSDPPELIAELDELVGPRALRFEAQAPASVRQLRTYIDGMVRGPGQQARALIHLLEGGDWRFAFGAFGECHQAGHWLWRLSDPSHPDHDPDMPSDVRDGLMRVYEATDRAIGEVIAALPPDTTVLVVSPYDMYPNPHFDDALPMVLERGGWLVRPPAQRASARVRTLRAARRAVRATVPLALRPALGRLAGRDRLLVELALAEFDWARTRAMPIPSDGSSAIRLNLAGRDPQGTVQPGAEAERELTDLAECLYELRCADSGASVVARIARYEELYDAAPFSGPAELFIEWSRVSCPRVITSERIGEVTVPRHRTRQTNHCSPGFVVAAGPGIEAAGAPYALRGRDEARLADVAPTVLGLLGVVQPETVTGRPIAALVPEAAEAAEPA
jgi:predicted AlkP superfamily phosphohydrolase/phosphomutase